MNELRCIHKFAQMIAQMYSNDTDEQLLGEFLFVVICDNLWTEFLMTICGQSFFVFGDLWTAFLFPSLKR